MSNDKTKNQLAEILARKKAAQNQQQGQFNPKEGKKGKIGKGFGGSTMIRKTGRGS